MLENHAALKSGALGKPWPGIIAVAVALILGLVVARLPLAQATIVVLGISAVLLTIIQPLFGLALALLAGPWGALEQLFSGVVSLDSSQVILAITLASWFAHMLARKRIRLPATPLNLPLFIFVFAGLISLLGAISIATGIKELLKWLEIWLVMLLVLDLGRRGKVAASGGYSRRSVLGGAPRTLWIVMMLLAAGLSQAFIGIWQFGIRGDGPEHFLVLGRFYRAYGTYEQPNPFGGYMNLTALLSLGILIGLLTALWLWWQDQKDYEDLAAHFAPSWQFIWATTSLAIVTAVTTLALVFSWSRGAWLGFVSGAAVMVLFFPRRRIVGIALFAAAAAFGLLAYSSGQLPATVTARLTSFTEDLSVGDVRGADINDENYSVLERQAHWQAGVSMFRDDVLLGIGFGNYAEAYADYALINWPDALGHAHNYYINLLAETGVFGFLAYLLLWGIVLIQTMRLLRNLPWPDRGLALGLLGVWVALAAHHLVDKLYVNNIYIHLGVLLGLLQLLSLHACKGRERKESH